MKKKRPHLILGASRSGLAVIHVEGTTQPCLSAGKYASSNGLPGRPGLHGSNQNIRYYCNASKLRSEDIKKRDLRCGTEPLFRANRTLASQIWGSTD